MYLRYPKCMCFRCYEFKSAFFDEIIISCLEEEKTHAQELVERRMSTPPRWAQDLPVACESGVGYNYGDAK